MVTHDRYKISDFINEMGVSSEDIAVLFDQYFQEMNEEIHVIQKLLIENSLDMLQKVIHNVKGVSANLGIYDVQEKAVIIDIKLKNKDNDDLGSQVNELEILIEEAHREVQSYFIGIGISLIQ